MDEIKNTDSTNKTLRSQDQTTLVEKGASCSYRWKIKVLRISVICLIIVCLLLICARIALPGMLVSVANKQFSNYFTSLVKLKAVHLDLLNGSATVQGLTVRQPDGFGGDLLLDLPEAKVKVSIWSLITSSLIIDEVTITDFIIHLVRDKEGKVNVPCLIRSAEVKPNSEENPKTIHIKKITVKNSTVQYTDYALGSEPLDVKIKQFNAVITDIYLNSTRSHEPSLPGRVEATAHVVQPKFSDAPLGIIARFGYFYSDQPIPELNAGVRLAGLELQTLHALVKQDNAQAIGGDIMDFNGDLSMAPEVFDCSLGVITPSGDSLHLKVKGTPHHMLVDENSFQGIIANRLGEAGLNIIMNIPGTGEELGRTTVSSTKAASEGVDKMLTGIATTLFKTAISVSKGNMSEAGVNLIEGGSATLPNTQDMYGGASASLSSGVSRIGSASAGIGSEHARIWRADTQRRWTSNWETACKNIQQKPFPSPVSSTSTPK